MPNRFLDPIYRKAASLDHGALGDIDVASIDLPILNGMPLLGLALERGDLDAAAILLKRGADMNRRDLHGSTPLIRTVIKNELEIVEFLLRRGARVDRIDINRRTALHYASYLGYEEMVYCLLRYGADPNALDADQRSPLDYARSFLVDKPIPEIIKMLVTHGAIEDDNTRVGRVPKMHSDKDYLSWDYFIRHRNGYYLESSVSKLVSIRKR